MLLLFKHIEDVASNNPKYEHMVRLENYHFFSATVRPLKVCGVSVDAHGGEDRRIDRLKDLKESQADRQADRQTREQGRQAGSRQTALSLIHI